MSKLHAAFVCLCLCSLAQSLAQSSNPAETTSPITAASPQPAAASTQATPLPIRERERRIFVPYEDLEKVFTDGGKGVFLPYKEFLDLWNELTLKREDEEKVPVEAAVSKAEYTGRVEGKALVLEGKVTAESFKKGWTSVSLGEKGLGGLAEAETGKAVLKRAGDGFELLMPEKGIYEVTLKFILPIAEEEGRSRIATTFPRAAVSRMVLTLPGEGLELESKRGAFTSRPLGGQTEVSMVFGLDYEGDFSWGQPQAKTEMTPMLLADTELKSVIRAGSVASTAAVQLRVMRAPMEQFTLSVPTGQEILGVTGLGLKSWNVIPSADGRSTIQLVPEKPVRDEMKVELTLESAVAGLPLEVALPDVQVQGAAYARGSAMVLTEPQFDVTPKLLDSVVRSSEAVTLADGTLPVGKFRLLKQPWKLTALVEEAKPQVEVSSLTRTEILREAQKVEADFNYEVRRVGIYEAKITLPAGLNVSSVTSQAMSEWKVEPGAAGASGTLVVKLGKQTTGGFALHISGRILRSTPVEDAVLPVFQPLEISRHEAKLGVGVHSSLEANTKTPRDLQQEDVNALPNEAKGGATTELVLAFRHRDAAKPAVLSFKPRDPQVTAEVLTRIEAREQSTRHLWFIHLDVAYAAVDRVVIAVPKTVADQVRLEPSTLRDIKETLKNHAPTEAEKKLPDAANYVFWEIVLRSERMGKLQLQLSHEKQGALQAGKSGQVELIPLHVPGAFQETGQVAVMKDNSLELRNPKAEGLEEIDARELGGDLQQTGVFQAYKYRTPPVKLTVELAKNAYFAVPQAIVTHADLKTAVATDEAQSTEVIYWVKNIDLQFLVVSLPAGAALVSDVFVGKESQQPMRREGSEDLLVRLPSGGSQEAVPVRFVYEVKSTNPGGTMGMRGSFAVKPPSIGAVKVLSTRHRLYLPPAWHYTGFDGPLSEALVDRGWLRVRRVIDPFIPALGPVLSRAGEERRQEPPAVGKDIASLYDFQVPEQGQLTTLRRLGEPAETRVHYQSKKLSFVFEAVAFMLVLLMGIKGMSWTLSRKTAVVFLVGALATVASGLVGPVYMLVALAVFYGLAAAVALWMVSAVLQWWNKPKPTPPPPAPTHRVEPDKKDDDDQGGGPVVTQQPVQPMPPGGMAAMIPPPASGSNAGTVTSDSAKVEVIQIPEVKE